MDVDYLNITSKEENIFIVKNKLNNKYVKLGKREIKYLCEIHKVKEIEFDLGNEILCEEEKKILFEKFKQWGFVCKEDEANQRKQRRFDDITKIHLFSLNPNKVLKIFYPLIAPFFSLYGIIVLLACFITVLYCWVFKLEAIGEALLNINLTGIDTVILFVSMICTVIIHEFCHAVACKKYTGDVGEMGMLLFFGLPSFFCRVSDVYLIQDNKKSFIVAISGILSNFILSSISFLIYVILFDKGIYIPILFYYYVANLGFMALNLIPFVKLDGYWILTSMFGIDNMLDKSILLFLQVIFNKKEVQFLKNMPVKRALFIVYGGIAFFFRPIFWWISIKSIYGIISAYIQGYVLWIILVFICGIILYELFQYYRKVINLYKLDRHRLLRDI